jgi:hypothetical protein
MRQQHDPESVANAVSIHPKYQWNSERPSVLIERLSGFGRRQPISDNFAFREIP